MKFITPREARIWLFTPLRKLAEREGVMANDDMVMTRVVKAIIGV
jgi:hypothetical protein